MEFKSRFLKSYFFSLVLIFCIIVGSGLGILFKEQATVFKPFGDVFLNLLFTLVVPMVFFSISSAVGVMTNAKRLGKIMVCMIVVFTAMGIISSAMSVAAVKLYPPAVGMKLEALGTVVDQTKTSVTQQLVNAVSVSDFVGLLSKQNMLALIVFSILVGLAASSVGEKGRAFTDMLVAGREVMMKALSYVMLYAPIGLGAYFAWLVGAFGPKLLGTYFRAMTLYYPLAIAYFVVGFTVYAYVAARGQGVRQFWSNIIPASLTAWGTGSSVATIPLNLEAAQRIGVPEDVREVVIPVGASMHMDGSCVAAVLKIAMLVGLFEVDFAGPHAWFKAIGVACLAGTVVSGIPGGGLLGEIMIINLYGFPMAALPLITMIGTLVDPPATMLNAIGGNVASMMVARILEGKNWIAKTKNSISI
jgi:Na+/H+-dicarboxylate symporter